MPDASQSPEKLSAYPEGPPVSETTYEPALTDFVVPGLSAEIRQRLAEVRPRSLGQASRIPGVTPAAVSILSVWCRRV